MFTVDHLQSQLLTRSRKKDCPTAAGALAGRQIPIELTTLQLFTTFSASLLLLLHFLPAAQNNIFTLSPLSLRDCQQAK